MNSPVVSLATGDIVVIAAYFLAVLVIGFRATRKSSTTSDFLLAGRSLTLPVFVMTLVSTWYGGILGVGEFSYLYGVSNWVVQGAPYYFFALIFALLFAERIRTSGLVSIPDKLEQSYGRPAAIAGAFLTFLLTSPAPYLLMLGTLLQLVSGWSMVACLLAGTTATVAYLLTGGFRADVQTDIVEFILMFVGFAIILPFAYLQFGGLEFIQSNIPPMHLTPHGGNSLQSILVWFFIALWTLVDPSFHQRCLAAESPSIARRGILWSIPFWVLFDAMTATAGLYARAAIPDLANPVMAFPMLAEITLPAFAKGLFYVGMLATIMSTVNTLTFVSAASIGRDIVWRMSATRDEDRAILYTRIALIAAAGVAIGMCLLIPSVIRQWYTIGTIIVPGLLIPLSTSYFNRLTVRPRFALWSMCIGCTVSACWMIAGWSREFGSTENYPLGMEPMFPGMLASLCIWGWGMKSVELRESSR